MQTKDWIILFTPIVCNGIILAILQDLVDKKIDEHISQKRKHMIFYEQIYEDLLKALDLVCKIDELFGMEKYSDNIYMDFAMHILRMERYAESFISDPKIKKEIDVLNEKTDYMCVCIQELCLYDIKDFANSKCAVSSDNKRAAKRLSKVEKHINKKEMAIMIQYGEDVQEAEKWLNDVKQQIKKLCKVIKF